MVALPNKNDIYIYSTNWQTPYIYILISFAHFIELFALVYAVYQLTVFSMSIILNQYTYSAKNYYTDKSILRTFAAHTHFWAAWFPHTQLNMFFALRKNLRKTKTNHSIDIYIIAKPHINLIRKWSSVCDTHSLMRNAAIAKYTRALDVYTCNMHYHNTAAVKRACMLTNSIRVPIPRSYGWQLQHSKATATPYVYIAEKRSTFNINEIRKVYGKFQLLRI